jgi:ribose transport system substrate-binding protein
VSGNGQRGASREAVRHHLKTSTAKRILVGAINDLSAIGAQDAFKDAERLQNCAIVGQNGSIEARMEMRDPNTRMVGSVAYFPERYGEQLIPLALNILSRQNPVPRAVFIKQQLLTPSNLKQFYGRETRASTKASRASSK